MQQGLLAEFQASGKQDGYVYEELGECLLALSQPEQARPYFAYAYEELSRDTWLVEQEPARMQRLQALGHVQQDERGGTGAVLQVWRDIM
jgi:hypothetical protein